MGLVGWIQPLLQVLYFDRIYLNWGRARRYELGGSLVSRLATPPTAPEITNLIDRSQAVDAVRRLLVANGFRVELFPRDRATNPLQLNVDLFGSAPPAGSRQKSLVVVVKTRDDAPAGVDWTAGSALQTAVWGLAGQQDLPPGDVQPLMVLVETSRDETLDMFSKSVGIALLDVTRTEIEKIRANESGVVQDLIRRLHDALEASQRVELERLGGSSG
jgi:hypothetical protein